MKKRLSSQGSSHNLTRLWENLNFHNFSQHSLNFGLVELCVEDSINAKFVDLKSGDFLDCKEYIGQINRKLYLAYYAVNFVETFRYSDVDIQS